MNGTINKPERGLFVLAVAYGNGKHAWIASRLVRAQSAGDISAALEDMRSAEMAPSDVGLLAAVVQMITPDDVAWLLGDTEYLDGRASR